MALCNIFVKYENNIDVTENLGILIEFQIYIGLILAVVCYVKYIWIICSSVLS